MLVIIDMQNDFIDQGKGKMVVKEADKLVSGTIQKIKEYEKRGDLVLYTLNIHRDMPDDNRPKEEKIWGEEIYSLLKAFLINHIPVKKYYYGVYPYTLRKLLDQYENMGRYLNIIEIIGVETNLCVLTNAIILQTLFHDSNIIIDANLCTSNDMELHWKALDIMRKMNIEVKNYGIK